MNFLHLDIETVPTKSALDEFAANWTTTESLTEAEVKAALDEGMKQLSLSSLTARILCLGFAHNDKPADIVHGDEAEILKLFWDIAPRTNIFVGYNIMDFDLKFICQRSVINGIKPTRDIPFIRFRQAPIYDCMQEWNKWGFQGKCSLDALCRALGISSPKSDGVDGSKVFPLYREGRLDEIWEYCKRDVESVREVYRRMTFAK